MLRYAGEIQALLPAQPRVACVTLGTSQGLCFPICQTGYSGDLLECPGPHSWKVLTLLFVYSSECFQGSSLPGTVSSPSAPHTDRPHCMALHLGFSAVPSPPPGPLSSFLSGSAGVCLWGVRRGFLGMTWYTLRNEGSRASWKYPGRLTPEVEVPAQG